LIPFAMVRFIRGHLKVAATGFFSPI